MCQLTLPYALQLYIAWVKRQKNPHSQVNVLRLGKGVLLIKSKLTKIHFDYLLWTDEKEKYDPAGFRDSVLSGLAEAGEDPESIYKFLDTAGSKLDYRRYGEVLFDVLIAGGLLGKF